MGKIGIFGGSFNPPHKGHILAAQEAVRALGLDQVLFVPAAHPPHKTLPNGSPDGNIRRSLLELAISGIPWAKLCTLELERSGPSYTVDTLRSLKQQFPDDTFYLIMGSDMFLSLHTWFQPESICSMAKIVLCIRESISEKKHVELEWQTRMLQEKYAADILIPNTQFIQISSTMVRRMLIFDCAQAQMDSSVIAFIQKNGLYQTGINLKNLPFDQLKAVSLALHKPKRVPHVCGVSSTAVALAKRWGENEEVAARAGILHDITKALGREEQLQLCEKYGMITTAFEQTHYKPLHAWTGAGVARHIFGENDAVCQAIYWHTTGRPEMTMMEKILYLADYIEPTRSQAGVEELRTLAFQDIDAAMYLGISMAVDELLLEQKPLWPQSLLTRDWYRRRKEREE